MFVVNSRVKIVVKMLSGKFVQDLVIIDVILYWDVTLVRFIISNVQTPVGVRKGMQEKLMIIQSAFQRKNVFKFIV